MCCGTGISICLLSKVNLVLALQYGLQVSYPLGFLNGKPGTPSTSNLSCFSYANGPFDSVAFSIDK